MTGPGDVKALQGRAGYRLRIGSYWMMSDEDADTVRGAGWGGGLTARRPSCRPPHIVPGVRKERSQRTTSWMGVLNGTSK